MARSLSKGRADVISNQGTHQVVQFAHHVGEEKTE